MRLPEWKAIPVRTRRSRKRLHNLIAAEFSLDTWIELPLYMKKSKRHLYDYYAKELHLEEFKELKKRNIRGAKTYYEYLKLNADPSDAPTLTIVVVDEEDNALEDASVTIGEDTVATDKDGEATFSLDYDNYNAEISLTNYITQNVLLKFRSNKKTFKIILLEDGE